MGPPGSRSINMKYLMAARLHRTLTDAGCWLSAAASTTVEHMLSEEGRVRNKRSGLARREQVPRLVLFLLSVYRGRVGKVPDGTSLLIYACGSNFDRALHDSCRGSCYNDTTRRGPQLTSGPADRVTRHVHVALLSDTGDGPKLFRFHFYSPELLMVPTIREEKFECWHPCRYTTLRSNWQAQKGLMTEQTECQCCCVVQSISHRTVE